MTLASSPLCLLTLHAHPDDEASKGSATVAKYAAEGVRTVLVCCTGGEAGEVLNKAIQPEDVGMACVFLASLPARTYVPELIMMPPALQVMGQAIA